MALLAAKHAEALTRWQLAETVGASEDYLTRVFSKELGLSPWDWLNRYRVLRAKTLLLDEALSVAEVAARVGYRDQAYFSRVFRKIAGLAPLEWRRGQRALV